MVADRFLRNKISRQIEWNGRDLLFERYAKDEYGQLKDYVEETYEMRAIFHEGGGYGGMLNIEIYENDGARTTTKMKPMLLCLYEDGVKIQNDDWVTVSGRRFSVVDKSDVSGLNVAFEVSLELDNRRAN